MREAANWFDQFDESTRTTITHSSAKVKNPYLGNHGYAKYHGESVLIDRAFSPNEHMPGQRLSGEKLTTARPRPIINRGSRRGRSDSDIC